MYLNDLNSASHNVDKINSVLANTFGHNIDISEMSTNALERMLTATDAKIVQIKESDRAYWENPQYNKLHLISHSLRTYINEVAPGRTDGKTMKVKEATDLEQAEVMLAAQELVDELQKMVENLAEMQVQKLMPIVDAMKEQVGFEQAEAYNAGADAALAGLLDQAKAAKEALENATLAARGEAPAEPMPTDMGAEEPEMDMSAEPEMDMGDDFGADDAAAGEENTLGRELKGESAIADMEGRVLAEKKFLESKDRLFKMVQEGQLSQEQFLDLLGELNSPNRYVPHGYYDGADAAVDKKMNRDVPIKTAINYAKKKRPEMDLGDWGDGPNPRRPEPKTIQQRLKPKSQFRTFNPKDIQG